MNHLLRKRALFSLSKQTVAALISSQSLASVPISSIVVSAHSNFVSNGTSEQFYRSTDLEVEFGLNRRLFHVSSGPLGFKTSSIAQAEYAVDDLSYDEKFGGEKSDTEEGIEISKLNISKEIISSLSKKGITRLFPIQKAVLEPAMEGRDMIGRARTGTGKTLAFGIPILDKIIRFNEKHGRGRNPLALVMAPTRELARQVEKEFRESAPILDTLCVYGGVPISSQMRQLDYGVDVIVGTPGRIIDLLNRGSLNLSEVKFVVLDEADQMLNIGFEENVEEILQNIRQEHQTVMFSATMPTAIRKLAQKYLKNPLHIDLVGDSDQKLASGITLYSVAADMYGKPSILGPLITEHAKGGKCIIFTQRKRDADQLAYSMARSFKCEALHGDISQNQRERTLSGFRDGHFNILVATDVAARGLDIPNVDLVIHYELPNTSEIFVHRSGRTGRAGKKGSAILIHTEQEARAVKVIEREIGCKFNQLPRIAIEAGSQDMFGGMGSGLMGSRAGGRFGSIGDRSRNSGFGRSGGFGESSFGRSGGFGESSFRRSGDESSFGRSGGSSFNRSGGFGGSSFNRSGGSSFNRSGGFGGSGGSSRFGSGFENSSSEKSGGFASVFGSYGGSEGSRFGKSHGFGDTLSGDSSNSGSNKSTDFSNSASSLFGGSRSNSSGFGRFGSRGSSEE